MAGDLQGFVHVQVLAGILGKAVGIDLDDQPLEQSGIFLLLLRCSTPPVLAKHEPADIGHVEALVQQDAEASHRFFAGQLRLDQHVDRSRADLALLTTALLQDTRPGWRRTLAALRDTTRMLAGAEAKLAETVKTLPMVGAAFARTMSYGARLNVYLCNLGFRLAGQEVWVNGGGGPYSEVCR